MKSILSDPRVEQLVKLIEESTRSSQEGEKRFIEPAPGTLSRATNKRHHIISGRRGSGKSSLLRKAAADLTLAEMIRKGDRIPYPRHWQRLAQLAGVSNP